MYGSLNHDLLWNTHHTHCNAIKLHKMHFLITISADPSTGADKSNGDPGLSTKDTWEAMKIIMFLFYRY